MKWRASSRRCGGETSKKYIYIKQKIHDSERVGTMSPTERKVDAVDAKIKTKKPPNREDEGQKEQEGIKCLRVMYEKSGEEEIY